MGHIGNEGIRDNERHRRYNVAFERVLATIVAVEKQSVLHILIVCL